MTLIRSYGLFWRRDIISASVWPRNGKLLGIGARAKRRGEVDFANQVGIYALYDDQFRLIYVGQAGRMKSRLYNRLRYHTITNLSERWSRFSWFGLLDAVELNDPDSPFDKTVSKNVVMDHIEAVLIAASEPLRNKHSGRFGKAVPHYRQWKENDELVETDDADEAESEE